MTCFSKKQQELIAKTEEEMKPFHDPKHKYDCKRCKFNWCCGPTCACVLRGDSYSEPPKWRADEVEAAQEARRAERA